MALPPDAPRETRAERLLGLGKPTPRSGLSDGFFALGVVFGTGVILWILLSGGWDGQGFLVLGLLCVMAWQLCDEGGALAYLRRGAAWGRSLRVWGYAVFWPLWLASMLLFSWRESSVVFALFALALGVFVARLAVRCAGMLRWDARERGGR